MLREDYTRFRKEFPEKSRDPKFVFRCAEDDKTWHLPFGKVMNTETLFLQDDPIYGQPGFDDAGPGTSCH